MVSRFLQLQMDYIFFFYGLAFMFMAATTWALSYAEGRQLPWKWLSLFGLIHGINEWLDMFAFYIKDTPSYAMLRLIIMVISFLFLIEFGRLGSNSLTKKQTGRWIFIPLLLLAGLGALKGINGLNSAARYALALPGSVWSCITLWQFRQIVHPQSRSLLIVVSSMAFYGLAASVVTPKNSFFPASFLNYDSFFSFTGFPVQLLRGVLACILSTAIWQHYCSYRKKSFKTVISKKVFHNEFFVMATIVAVLSAGWFMTMSFGDYGRQRDREHYESELELARRMLEDSVQNVSDLTKALASSPDLVTIGSQTQRELAAINSTLDLYARVIRGSICYILDVDGTTIASTNRNTAESFVGHSYEFRPYFKEALDGGQGSYVAVGLTSITPGYYASHSIKNPDEKIVGVVVVKLNLDKLYIAPIGDNLGFLVNSNGIILDSTESGYFLNTLRPINENVRRHYAESNQFPGIADFPVISFDTVPGKLFSLDGEIFQIFSQSTSVEDLSFVLLGPMNTWKIMRLGSIFITMLVVALLVTFFVIQQRNSDSSARIAASEKLYRTLVTGSPNWVGLFDHEGRCVSINGNGLKAMGRKESEVEGRTFSEIWSKATEPTIEDSVRQVLRGDRLSFEMEQPRPAGTSTTWHMVLNPVLKQDGSVSSFVGIAIDISSRKQAEKAVQESERRHREYIDSTPLGVFVTNEHGQYLQVNPAGCKITGYCKEEILTMNISDLMLKETLLEDMRNFEKLHREGKTECEIRFCPKNGERRWWSVTGVKISDNRFLCFCNDITTRKSVEEEKAKLETVNLQLQKAESLSRMAGAIAHHFNNQLGAVMGNLEMAIDDLPENSETGSTLTAAMRASRKAVEISSLLLTYLGQTPGKYTPLDLSKTCRQNLPLLQAAVPKNIIFNIDLPVPGPIIHADANQIQQVLMNLVTNAREAVEKNQGSIDLTVKLASSADISAINYFPIDWQSQNFHYACLEVKDGGSGIPDADIENLFDPFFSSKFTGRGLGLSIVQGIAKAHNGVITVHSQMGRGSIFRVFFPLSEEEVPQLSAKAVTPFFPENISTVLLVEDDEMMRNMAKTILTRLGYKVLLAVDGCEAVEMFRQRMNHITVVLCDLTIPRMDGWETLSALRQIQPGVPMVLTSGRDESRALENDHRADLLHSIFLPKPYKKAELKSALERAIAASS